MSEPQPSPETNPTGLPTSDSTTGQPEESHRPDEISDAAPAPPPGQSPTLEWIPKDWGTLWKTSVTMFVIVVVATTLKDLGVGWMGTWWLWLMNVILSALFGLGTWSSEAMEAGADWFKYGRSWVKTYELTEVKLEVSSRGGDSLELKDAAGREVWITLSDIQSNWDLWNLVYDGIVHSVHHGGAVANEEAITWLLLDEQTWDEFLADQPEN